MVLFFPVMQIKFVPDTTEEKMCLGKKERRPCSGIVFAKYAKMYLPSLSVSWYHVTLESRGKAKGYNSETWH